MVVVEGQLAGLFTYDEAGQYVLGATFYITAAWGENDISAGLVVLQLVTEMFL